MPSKLDGGWPRGVLQTMMLRAHTPCAEAVVVLSSVVSPYEFHTRAIGVYAALTLSDRVVTPLPTDHAGDTSALRPEDVPRTLAAAREWAWSGALWREGLMAPAFDEEGPLDDVGAVCDEIAASPEWIDIRPMIARDLFTDPRARLEAVARDLIHGGIHPGVSIPVSCGLARYAARRGAVMFRSPATSTVTKLEARSTSVGARCALPVLDGVDARTLLALRETLEEPLLEVRGAMRETIETLRSVGVTPEDLQGVEREVLMPACEAYASAFADHRRVLCERAEDEGSRYRVRSLTLSLGVCDADAVLRASAAAARSMRGKAARASENSPRDGNGALGRRALAVCAVSVRRLAAAPA